MTPAGAPARRATSAVPATARGRLFSAPPLLIERAMAEPDLGALPRRGLHEVLAAGPLDDSAQLVRARDAMDWWAALQAEGPDPAEHRSPLPEFPYVLVLDETRRRPDAPSEEAMREMLVFAQTETLNARVAVLGCADGYFGTEDDPRLTRLPPGTALYPALERATAVYTHGAGYGFDAILAGHRPRVFGMPWYHGLGLTGDEVPPPAPRPAFTRAQLFAAVALEALDWQAGGRSCTLESLLARLEARARARREDAAGYVASGILPWKRRFLRRYIGAGGLSFRDDAEGIARARGAGRRHLAWGAAQPEADLRIEDGFLRSRGLGAALVRPVSLVFDDLGIYFDPTRPSRLEALIAARADLPQHAARRIEALLSRLTALDLSKYNVGRGLPELPPGHRILVAGQVEDDASIRLGAGTPATNRALLDAARRAHPGAVIVYKPHPDVEAGLRRGHLPDAARIADVVARDADPLALIAACDELWTMTSLIGFEALLRGRPVTCTGAPFYAGWGLTTDLGPVPARRSRRVSLAALAHATLIDYPRYFHPRSGAPLSPEEAIEHLAEAPDGRSRAAQVLLARLRQLRARWLGLAG
ncbi:hypothetical protein [Celeribacter indicus]|uniref:Capsular polysaccharide export protein KpsC n=1 Tax=Celeribacter indicus TaxID=1208324 RepID=A0A0B5E3R5_9RHOB|nr:hypothetical protein [Celeribacter indicus]AJE48020.1 capsular polysaccharide export protein KpsC [Celeribacter indicus]SDW29680.1 capsular polysaccharide export protein [Celeribacter indicus]